MDNIPISQAVFNKWLQHKKRCDRNKECGFTYKAIEALEEQRKVNKASISGPQYETVGFLINEATQYLNLLTSEERVTDSFKLGALFRRSQSCYWYIDDLNSGRKALLWTALGDLQYSLWNLDYWALCDLLKYNENHIVTSGQAKENDATPMA